MQSDAASNDERDVDQLIAALQAGPMGERIRAAKALGKLGDERALAPLRWARQQDTLDPLFHWFGQAATEAIRLIEERRQQK
jgi:HEAT repeat protein